MRNDQMIKINHSLTSLSPEISLQEKNETSKTQYYHAIRDLKDVHQKIASIKARIGNMVLKHNKTKHQNISHLELMTFRHNFFKEQLREENERRLLQKIKNNTQAQLRRIQTWNRRQNIVKGIQRARNHTMMTKFTSYGHVKESSIENLKTISRNNLQIFLKNQKRHDLLYKQQRNHKKMMKSIEEQKKRQVKQFCSLQTKTVRLKVQKKRKQLIKLQTQCEKYEKKIESITKRNKNKIKSLMQNLEKLTSLSTNRSFKEEISSRSHEKLATIG